MPPQVLSRKPKTDEIIQPSLAGKVAFLSRPETYDKPAGGVSFRETHMSWVFLAGDRVFKLKKPVRFPYLDFSTLARREAACRAELKLNRRLAADVYLEVAPLVWARGAFSVGGEGETVDWLVVSAGWTKQARLSACFSTAVSPSEISTGSSLLYPIFIGMQAASTLAALNI